MGAIQAKHPLLLRGASVGNFVTLIRLRYCLIQYVFKHIVDLKVAHLPDVKDDAANWTPVVSKEGLHVFLNPPQSLIRSTSLQLELVQGALIGKCDDELLKVGSKAAPGGKGGKQPLRIVEEKNSSMTVSDLEKCFVSLMSNFVSV
jgi:hypothetical protein